MRGIKELLRGVGIILVVLLAPHAITATPQVTAESCNIYWDWYGYQCLSCADYEECEDDFAPWEWACCNVQGDEATCHSGGGEVCCSPDGCLN